MNPGDRELTDICLERRSRRFAPGAPVRQSFEIVHMVLGRLARFGDFGSVFRSWR